MHRLGKNSQKFLTILWEVGFPTMGEFSKVADVAQPKISKALSSEDDNQLLKMSEMRRVLALIPSKYWGDVLLLFGYKFFPKPDNLQQASQSISKMLHGDEAA